MHVCTLYIILILHTMLLLPPLQLEAEKTKVPGMVKETDHDDTEESAVSETLIIITMFCAYKIIIVLFCGHVHVWCIYTCTCTCMCT